MLKFSKENARLFARLFAVNSIPPAHQELRTVPEVLHRLRDIKYQVKRVRDILQTFNTKEGIPAVLLKKCAPVPTQTLTFI